MSKKIKITISICILFLSTAVLVGIIGSKFFFKTNTTSSVHLLSQPVTLKGEKELKKITQNISPSTFKSKDAIELSLNFNGTCPTNGGGSILTLVDSTNQKESSLSLAPYVRTCSNQLTKIQISLSDFPLSFSPDRIEFSFFHPSIYSVEISDISVINSEGKILGISSGKKDPLKKYASITPIYKNPFTPLDQVKTYH